LGGAGLLVEEGDRAGWNSGLSRVERQHQDKINELFMEPVAVCSVVC
jgi:hypothetical protein